MPTGPPQTSGMNQMSTFEPKNHYGNKGYNQKISVLEKLKIGLTWSLNESRQIPCSLVKKFHKNH